MPPKNKKKEPDNETLTRIAIVSADRLALLPHSEQSLLHVQFDVALNSYCRQRYGAFDAELEEAAPAVHAEGNVLEGSLNGLTCMPWSFSSK